jgi:hypothetical protein
MSALYPFIALLLVAVIINYIPMDAMIQRVINIIIGVVALLMLLQFVHFI